MLADLRDHPHGLVHCVLNLLKAWLNDDVGERENQISHKTRAWPLCTIISVAAVCGTN